MNDRRGVPRLITVLVAIIALATACSSVEDDLRADLRNSGLSNDAVDCVFDAFDRAGVDLDDLSGTTQVSPAAEAAMAPCMQQVFGEMFAELDDAFQDELGAVELDVTQAEPVDLGGLVDACQGGDNSACDDLWVHSPFDSPEEAIAESCGGRSAEPRMGLCSFHLD